MSHGRAIATHTYKSIFRNFYQTGKLAALECRVIKLVRSTIEAWSRQKHILTLLNRETASLNICGK